MADIINLPPPPGKATPNREVIAQLRLLLSLAEMGSVTSFAYVAIGDPNKAPATGYAGAHRNALIAGTVLLTSETMWQRAGA